MKYMDEVANYYNLDVRGIEEWMGVFIGKGTIEPGLCRSKSFEQELMDSVVKKVSQWQRSDASEEELRNLLRSFNSP